MALTSVGKIGNYLMFYASNRCGCYSHLSWVAVKTTRWCYIPLNATRPIHFSCTENTKPNYVWFIYFFTSTKIVSNITTQQYVSTKH